MNVQQLRYDRLWPAILPKLTSRGIDAAKAKIELDLLWKCQDDNERRDSFLSHLTGLSNDGDFDSVYSEFKFMFAFRNTFPNQNEPFFLRLKSNPDMSLYLDGKYINVEIKSISPMRDSSLIPRYFEQISRLPSGQAIFIRPLSQEKAFEDIMEDVIEDFRIGGVREIRNKDFETKNIGLINNIYKTEPAISSRSLKINIEDLETLMLKKLRDKPSQFHKAEAVAFYSNDVKFQMNEMKDVLTRIKTITEFSHINYWMAVNFWDEMTVEIL